jgi:hypothetical protein
MRENDDGLRDMGTHDLLTIPRRIFDERFARVKITEEGRILPDDKHFAGLKNLNVYMVRIFACLI